MKKRTLLLIGNGMAGMRFLEEMVERGAHAFYHIVVCGTEPDVAYQRMQQSLLVGSQSDDPTQLPCSQWHAEHGIDLRTDARVANLDCIERVAQLEGGEEIAYDVVVLATGAKAVIPALPGLAASEPHVYRTVKDAKRLQQFTEAGSRATIIGSGLLALEVAASLLQRGVRVTLLQGTEQASGNARLIEKLQAKGLLILGSAERVWVEGDVKKVALADGRVIESEHLVVAAGITPNTELALQAGLSVGKGVRVDRDLQTTSRDVYAIGECAEHAGTLHGLVEPLYRVASALADRLSDLHGPAFANSRPASRPRIPSTNVLAMIFASKVEFEFDDEDLVPEFLDQLPFGRSEPEAEAA